MDLMTSPQEGSDRPAISVAGPRAPLRRPRRRRRRRPRGPGRVRSTASSGRTAAGKSTTVRMLCTLLAPDRRPRASWPATTSPPSPSRCGCASASPSRTSRSTRKQTGVELLRLQGRLYGLTRRETDQRVDELATLIDIGDALDRQIGTYSGGHEAAARPRRRARAQPRGAVPRRAHHRARPDQPRARVGGGAPAQRRARHDDLPHHAVPRGGRRAGRPGRHHQPRHAGRRGHARPSSSARSATTSSWPGSTATARRPRRAVAGIDGRRRASRSTATRSRSPPSDGAAAISPVAVALNDCGVRVREHHAAHAHARRRVPRAHRQPHPARRRDTEEDEAA